MKNKNITTLVSFNVDNQDFSPVKNVISEELKNIISTVATYDENTAMTLNWLTNIILEHFHEDVTPIKNKDIRAIDHAIHGLPSRLEKAKLMLLKAGYDEQVAFTNPGWFIDMALQDIKHFRKLITRKEYHD